MARPFVRVRGRKCKGWGKNGAVRSVKGKCVYAKLGAQVHDMTDALGVGRWGLDDLLKCDLI